MFYPLEPIIQRPIGLKSIFGRLVGLGLLILAKIVFYRKKHPVWLVACGGERWGDNADAFWRYMNQEHPEIAVFAVIKNESDMRSIKYNRVKRGTLISFLLIMQAEVFAITHTLTDVGPEIIVSCAKAKKVRLQHGVIAIGKLTAEKAKMGHYDLICASSRKEKELMAGELGIKDELIAVTGLARHDYLKEKINRGLSRDGLLYVPTSRAWADQEQKQTFEQLFFTWINKFLEKGYGQRIKLWLHPGWTRSGLGELGLTCTGVEHYDYKEDPQKLICTSELLITDYSSVFFDAAISGAPTVFYQPDRQEYMEKKGLFQDFLDQDTLLMVQDQAALLNCLEKIILDRAYYIERVKKDQQWAYKYVETFDGQACQRIYREIIKLFQG